MTAKAPKLNVIRPQEGYQMDFLSTAADIAIGGGAAGVGKTFSLLLEPLRNKDVEGFGSVIFRRTSPQIRNEGGLWDTSQQLYNLVGAQPKESVLTWDFGITKLKFSHLQHENDIYDYQGAQIPFLAFDELTHFTKKMFFYMLTRNGSGCGVNPYVRATCNPDPDSWLADFLEWWIDQETGFPIPERAGKLRYMVVDGDKIIWGDSADEVIQKAWYILEPVVKKAGINPKDLVKSVTFIPGDIYDNKKLLETNPAYLGNLMAQDEATKAALLHSNWKQVVSDNDIYEYNAFKGMFVNKYDVTGPARYITADIAGKGSDNFVVGYWDGYLLSDLLVMPKSNGPQVIEGIERFAREYKVPNHNIAYDNDGIGQLVDGFIEGAIGFNNGGTPMDDPENIVTDANGKPVKPNYFNLKTQCYYRSGDGVKKGLYGVSEKVANMMFNNSQTVKQRFMQERRAIKRDKADMDGKLRILPKDQMKTFNNGQSPDLMDMFMMREVFNLVRESWDLSDLFSFS